jgi:hypothetical protein
MIPQHFYLPQRRSVYDHLTLPLPLIQVLEKTSEAIRAAYRTACERFFGDSEQPMQHDTNSPSEQAGEFLVQKENPKTETEGSHKEAEEGSSQELVV